jgi:hypothetical protein
MHLCQNGHEVRGPQDLTDGSCRRCAHARQVRHRAKVRQAVEFSQWVEALEAQFPPIATWTADD